MGLWEDEMLGTRLERTNGSCVSATRSCTMTVRVTTGIPASLRWLDF